MRSLADDTEASMTPQMASPAITPPLGPPAQAANRKMQTLP